MVDFSAIPLFALSDETKQLISVLLNPPKLIPTEDKIARDWRGLANEMCISGENLPLLANCSDPTGYIIVHAQKQTKCMFTDLFKALEKLDRWDILVDAESLFEKDAKLYLEIKQKSSTNAQPIKNLESEILTIDDLYREKDGLQKMHYDAFLLFAEEDHDFATQIIDYLENKSNLKLCIKDRNLIPGLSFTHKTIIQLISERCNRLIVVLSPSFLVSEENSFFMNYAQAIGIDKRQRKIVPCIYKRCSLPIELQYMYILDYNRPSYYNFWEKLRASVQLHEEEKKDWCDMGKKNVNLKALDQCNQPSDTKNNISKAAADQDLSLLLPTVSHLEDPEKNAVSKMHISTVSKKNSSKKKLEIFRKSVNQNALDQLAKPTDKQNNREVPVSDQSSELSLPTVSNLEELGKSDSSILPKKKNSKKNYIRKKLQSFLKS